MHARHRRAKPTPFYRTAMRGHDGSESLAQIRCRDADLHNARFIDAGDADKFEGLVVDLALARVLDHHLLGPGQNADACGCLAASALNVKSIPVLVK